LNLVAGAYKLVGCRQPGEPGSNHHDLHGAYCPRE
jgi:hypothetical protein